MEPVPSKKVRGDIEKSGAGPNVGNTLGGSIRAKVCLFEITSAESVLVEYNRRTIVLVSRCDVKKTSE